MNERSRRVTVQWTLKRRNRKRTGCLEAVQMKKLLFCPSIY